MESNKAIEFTDANFETEVLKSDGPVLVDFWAEWCGPCHAMSPIIEELAGQYEGSVKIGKLDVDRNPETAARLSISSIPSVLLFHQGQVEKTLIGAQPKRSYEEALKPFAARA